MCSLRCLHSCTCLDVSYSQSWRKGRQVRRRRIQPAARGLEARRWCLSCPSKTWVPSLADSFRRQRIEFVVEGCSLGVLVVSLPLLQPLVVAATRLDLDLKASCDRGDCRTTCVHLAARWTLHDVGSQARYFVCLHFSHLKVQETPFSRGGRWRRFGCLEETAQVAGVCLQIANGKGSRPEDERSLAASDGIEAARL